VKLPADQEDWQKRPAYIKENNAGVYICENRYALDYNTIDPGLRWLTAIFSPTLRLQYLVTKGAILRKG
jgi:hypothetical protein